MDMKKSPPKLAPKILPFQKAEHDFTLVIFGASGSLARLKIFPSLYQLALERRLPKRYAIVGFARSPMTDEQFHNEFALSVRAKYKENTDEKVLASVVKNVSYVAGQYDDAKSIKLLRAHVEKREKKAGGAERVRLCYLSVPPQVFEPLIHQLGAASFDTKYSRARLIIEKPFGFDLVSAKKLEDILERYFDESQIFLLDHYLGKESVFNILSLRYANPILTTLIRGQFVRNIQINGLESLGIEGRANYFDHVGSLRDMVQSHLFQILAFLTMDLPERITADSIHRAKRNLIESLVIKDLEKSVVRGQYRGYDTERGIPKSSKTETFTALRLFLDDMNWHNVPIYLRTGKRLAQQWTSVVVEFKPQPLQKFNTQLQTNKLVIQLQPAEKIEFHLLTKMGGTKTDFAPLLTGRPIYCSGDCLEEHGRLLLEAIRGDRMLFLCFPEIYASWRCIDQITERFAAGKPKMEIYAPGSFGPAGSNAMLKRFGHTWHNLV